MKIITPFSIYFSQDRSSALVIPVVSDLDIKCIVALPISLTTSSKSQRWNKPIFGLSFEVNLTTDVECFISKTQVNCDLGKKNKIHRHSYKEHVKISKIAKFGHEMF